MPEEFESYTRSLLGDELYQVLTDGLQQPTPVSIRLNPTVANLKEWQLPEDAERVPWSQYGFYLKGRPAFTFDPLFHAGAYYVQEASSMFAEFALREVLARINQETTTVGATPVTMLDLCAAPGGKSTCALSVLPEGSTLYANEPNRQRANILAENLQKWQLPTLAPLHPSTLAPSHLPTLHITNCYPRDYKKSKMLFDIVLADVPCSGEGMFRKDPAAIGEWSTANVEKCWRLQRDIIADIWHCLRPGGYLLYSTCTFNAHENEENVHWICHELGAEVISLPINPAWGIINGLPMSFPTDGMYRFLPGRTRGEGLFMAVVRKPPLLSPQRGKNTLPPDKEIEQSCLNDIKKHIIPPLEGKGEIGYSQALAFLRREAITLPPDTPRGPLVVSFQGLPLGMVKNIGNRANNLYPKEWRIKSTHIPNEYEAILKHS